MECLGYELVGPLILALLTSVAVVLALLPLGCVDGPVVGRDVGSIPVARIRLGEVDHHRHALMIHNAARRYALLIGRSSGFHHCCLAFGQNHCFYCYCVSLVALVADLIGRSYPQIFGPKSLLS